MISDHNIYSGSVVTLRNNDDSDENGDCNSGILHFVDRASCNDSW